MSYNLSLITCLLAGREPPPENIHISCLPPSVPTDHETEQTRRQGEDVCFVDTFCFCCVSGETSPLTLKDHCLLSLLIQGKLLMLIILLLNLFTTLSVCFHSPVTVTVCVQSMILVLNHVSSEARGMAVLVGWFTILNQAEISKQLTDGFS